ncbi:MAG: OmpA family protein [Bacteroidetes bacterium]|nr:OmpA family protein [Bacteroidota bacterium]
MLKCRHIAAMFLFLTGCWMNKLNAQQYDTLIVHFEFNKYNLLPQAKLSIDSFFSNLLQRGYIQGIALSGHCDSIGNNNYNDSLSLSRVNTVKAYLYEKGSTDRMLNGLIGWGKRYPAFDNNTDENRAFNRRVEIVIKSKLKPGITAPARPTRNVQVQKNISDFIKDPATKTGDQLILRNLNFIGGRHALMSYSLPLLTELLQTMREHPKLKIEVQGHICCERNGGDGYDYDTGTRDLSLQRAKFVCDYLIQNGIDPARLSYRGFGSSRKLYVDEINEEQQTANRRVEIKILSK